MTETTVHVSGHETLSGTVVGIDDPLEAIYEVLQEEGYDPNTMPRCQMQVSRADSSVQGAKIWEVSVMFE